jgi:hypothetical protein
MLKPPIDIHMDFVFTWQDLTFFFTILPETDATLHSTHPALAYLCLM